MTAFTRSRAVAARAQHPHAVTRWSLAPIAALALVAALVLGSQPAAARGAPESFADLAEELSPAVVNISTVQVIENSERNFNVPEGMPFGEFFEEFQERFGGRGNGEPREARSLGSGFIVDKSGYVVTNNHVVEKADEITVLTMGGEEYSAEIVGRDDRTDLALLKIKADGDLPTVSFGDSDEDRIGDWIMAIGNPFGIGHSVTAGIISARNRPIDAAGYVNYIQTDAAINRGNSGGPMFNMEGEVIGVNTAIFSPSGGNVGIGFAIPSNDARYVIDQLKENGKVRRGWLGVSIQDVNAAIARSLGLEEARGAIVSRVFPDSPAEGAGVKTGDIILQWDGKKVGDKANSLSRLVARTDIGKDVSLLILRDGDKKTLTLTTGEYPEELEAAQGGGQGDSDQFAGPDLIEGMELKALTNDMRRQLRVPDEVDGVAVTKVERSSEAYGAGVRRGAVIMRINQRPVENPQDVLSVIGDAKEQGRDTVLLLIHYRGNTAHLPLKLTEEEAE
ncbi:DegQ family serine endoprotease [Yunchengibacter salinarum]|uniref:DegQ family serine endoprotease n=1 Tax=Yunchengibacter salinarum TaxID=3133399 RepID=UPI0035B62177